MNSPIKSSFFLLMILLNLGCQPNRSTTDEMVMELAQADRDLLRHLKEVDWPKAYREQDTVLLDGILGDDFQMIDAQGNWSDKNLEMQWIKDNATQYDSFHYEIKRLQVFDNGTAIIAGTGHVYRDTLYTNYQSSNVLIKRGSNWKAVLSHVSGVKVGE